MNKADLVSEVAKVKEGGSSSGGLCFCNHQEGIEEEGHGHANRIRDL